MARVLVIDDEPVILKVLEEVLMDDGHEIVSASSGTEGIEILRQGLIPQLILIDLFMPGISGRDFVMKLREEFGLQTPVILMTGAVTSSPDFPPKGTYQSVISKPFDIMEVVEKVNQLALR